MEQPARLCLTVEFEQAQLVARLREGLLLERAHVQDVILFLLTRAGQGPGQRG